MIRMDEQSARYIAAALRYRHGGRAFAVASHEADLSRLRGDPATAARWEKVAGCLVGAGAGDGIAPGLAPAGRRH
jgi:hypothetical protein